MQLSGNLKDTTHIRSDEFAAIIFPARNLHREGETKTVILTPNSDFLDVEKIVEIQVSNPHQMRIPNLSVFFAKKFSIDGKLGKNRGGTVGLGIGYHWIFLPILDFLDVGNI